MRARDFIFEGQGLKAGRPGEIYKDQSGIEYEFKGWNWQFPANRDAYEDQETMFDDINAVTGGVEQVEWVNSLTPRLKSFAFASFKNDAGDELLIGKFYSKKSPNNTILDKEVTAVLGLTTGGSATVKSTAALQPGNLGIADSRSRSIQGLIKAVSTHENGPMLTAALKDASSGNNIEFIGGAPIATALQDDFCEVVAPVAMIVDHPQITGHLDYAVRDVFKGANIRKGSTIMFPPDQNNPLIDAYIINNGITLGVSHKGKQGARATITNIWKAKEEAAQNSTGAAYVKKFKEAVFILDTCKNESGLLQPVTLALRYKVISQLEADTLKKMLTAPRDPMYKLTGDPKNPNAVIRSPLAGDLKKVPPEMKRLFSMGGYKSGSYVSLICLARVAKLVADYINSDPKINFGEAIRSFLNSSAMVQAKSVVSVKGDDAILRSINIVYPPNFQEKAKLESNGYSGTQVKGKFSFSLPTT